ncbi:helix-turn-helix domain-containing protein [Baekduia sp.]|uniref:helix-turn-helix domain-containing protein n=1 Tax=Baekduia sp. TaxID=2600305 RepID=UPI0039C89257
MAVRPSTCESAAPASRIAVPVDRSISLGVRSTTGVRDGRGGGAAARQGGQAASGRRARQGRYWPVCDWARGDRGGGRLRYVDTADRPHDSEPLLTADEVASFMRVTRSWVYAETRRDALPHVRLGRYVRYRRSAIERWLDESQRGPRAR